MVNLSTDNCQLSTNMKGIVVKSTGKWYWVKTEEGEILRSRIVGKIRLLTKTTTNPVAVGDSVELEVSFEQDENIGKIKKVLKRTNYVLRQSPRRKHEVHLLAANVDQAVIIMTIVEPMLKQGFIDRFLLTTAPYNIPTIIVFNKSDLYDEDAMAMYEYLKAIYEKIGYTVQLASAEKGTGTQEIKDILKDKVTLVAGQSGVGKSTLVNAVQPDLDIFTYEISESSGKGQHTTTFAEMHELDFGGSIIDTPGIKMLSFNNLEKKDVAHNFLEFFELSSECKFGGSCLHRSEPKCAVKEAVEEGEVSELRYINYLTLLEEVENQNYWERHEM